MDKKVSFIQAILGSKVEIPALEGTIKLKILPGTQSHAVFRLKNQGIKKLHGFGRGDLYVKIIVEIPKKLSSKQKKLLEEFDSS